MKNTGSIQIFKQQKMIYKLMTVMLLCGIAFFVFRVIQNVILGINYPNELLEPSNVALTRMFLKGQSPYTVKSLSYDVPAINYEYPFLNSLIAVPIAFLMGGNAVAAHYIISFVSIIGTGVLGYMIIKQYSNTTAAPVAGAFIFMMCHWRFGFVSAAPDDLGLLLFVLTLYFACSPKIGNKPLICAIFTTLCFYTKQYYVFVAIGIFAYMLLYSKKEAIRYFVYTAVINVAAGIVVTLVWPLYWSYTFYFLYFGCSTGTGFGFSNLLAQMKYLLAIFVFMFAVIAVGLVMLIHKKRKADNSPAGNTDNSAGKKRKLIEISGNDPMSLFIVQIPVMFIPLLIFGRNDGAFLSYFLQLWMPSIVVVTLIVLERMKVDNDKLIFDLFYGFIVAFTVLFAYLKLPLHTLTAQEIANWKEAYQIVNEYREKGDVYYSQQLAYLAFENGDRYCYCGHDGEVSQQTLDVWNESKLGQILFPYVDDIIKKNIDFQIEIATKAFQSDFSLLTFENGNSLLFGEEFIDAGVYYKRLKRIPLQTGNMSYTVSFYVRADELQ